MKFNEEDIKKIEEILRTKPQIQIPEWREELLYEEIKYSITKISYYKIAALLISIFTIGIMYYFHLLEVYKRIENTQLQIEKSKNGLGVVVYVKGNSFLYDQEQNTKKVYTGTLVYTNDTIETKNDAKLEILLDKRIYIRIDSDTKIQLKNQDLIWKIHQERGISYHDIKLNQKENYYIETPTTIAGIRGTFLKIENQAEFTNIEVLKGKVEVFRKSQQGQIPNYLIQEEILEKNHSLFISNNEKKIIKNEKNQNLFVIYNEMVKNKEVFLNEVWEEIKKIPFTRNKNEIEQVYNKRVEIIKLRDGRILEGIIASQQKNNVILHTTEGIILVKLEDIKEIIFIND